MVDDDVMQDELADLPSSDGSIFLSDLVRDDDHRLMSDDQPLGVWT